MLHRYINQKSIWFITLFITPTSLKVTTDIWYAEKQRCFQTIAFLLIILDEKKESDVNIIKSILEI